MQDSLVPDANVTLDRDLHSKKQDRQIASTDGGMQMDESDEQLSNA
jgi:hypothetical protein